MVGLDAGTGAELWSIPFPDEWHENIVTPVWTGTALLMPGNRQGTHAYRVHEDADGWRWTEAWVNPDVTLNMSTPVLADGLFYGLSSKRRDQFVALDVTSGAIAWSSEGREGEHAAALLTRDHLIFLTNGAELTVARRDGATFDIEHSYQVAESETWAVPVLLGDDLLLRDEVSLIRLTPGG
ncbi:MAG: PQQ-binding-like beta-propeller repeat protein [bacterium]